MKGVAELLGGTELSGDPELVESGVEVESGVGWSPESGGAESRYTA